MYDVPYGVSFRRKSFFGCGKPVGNGRGVSTSTLVKVVEVPGAFLACDFLRDGGDDDDGGDMPQWTFVASGFGLLWQWLPSSQKRIGFALDAISARKDGWTGAARIRNSTELIKNS